MTFKKTYQDLKDYSTIICMINYYLVLFHFCTLMFNFQPRRPQMTLNRSITILTHNSHTLFALRKMWLLSVNTHFLLFLKNCVMQDWIFNRYRRKRSKVNASIFDSALSHTRRSNASEKKKKIAWWRCVHFWTFSPVNKFQVLACIG